MMMMERSTSARSPFSGPIERAHSISQTHTHSSEPKSEPMDITTTTGSPDMDSQGDSTALSDSIKPGTAGSSLAMASASNGLQQPKVQTAFIHKLYSMLEDAAIQHLISWATSGESFVMSPTGEFSKVLSQYFKHTNVSSFVRQLNMYGFHKVNDVFHSASPDSALWEFKHGGGSFKRGDLASLRDIRRRPSRPAIHKEPQYNHGNRHVVPSTPGTPNEQSVDTIEGRLASLEQAYWDVNNRVHRLEDANHTLGNQCQNLLEGLTRCHQWTIDLSQYIARIIPQSDVSILREIQSRQKEIERYATSLEESLETFQRERIPTFSFPPIDSAGPMSPRQGPQYDEDGRRPPPALRGGLGSGYFRPPFTSSTQNGSMGQRRFGSMSGPGGATPTSSLHPSSIDRLAPRASVTSLPVHPSHLSRRHTSADIRLQGWNPPGSSPFSHQSAVQWGNSTSSRSCEPQNAQDEAPPSFSNYEIRSQNPAPRPSFSVRKSPPPFEPSLSSIGPDSTWSFATAKQTTSPSKFDAPPPPMGSRRSSIVASGVHALLNPSSAQDTVSRLDNSSDKGSDTEPASEESRKRKRVD
ncbi:hypothetical protein TWF788_006361 [Orbilia oligospora]|uniref:HSF-type DNA-binding domain-containing protein n=1 Tax=Orbilia oligospora TaxID=2813651 RepID=A0A7C8PW58_ORBOL|nr:hypothetical protein TWF788_006361 [Orbilia oligospora]